MRYCVWYVTWLSIAIYLGIVSFYSLSHRSRFSCSKVQPSKFYGLDWKQCHHTLSVGRKLTDHHQEILTHKNITLPAKIMYLRMVTWMKMHRVCIVEWISRQGYSSLSKCRISIVCMRNLKQRPATTPCHLRFVKFFKPLQSSLYLVSVGPVRVTT